MTDKEFVEKSAEIYDAAISGKATFANQGQGMDGYSQLANYNALVEKFRSDQ